MCIRDSLYKVSHFGTQCPGSGQKNMVLGRIIWRKEVKQKFRSIVVSGVAIAVTATAGWAANPKLSPELQADNGADTVEIVVQYDQPPTQANHRRMASRGAALIHSYTAVWGSLYTTRRSSLASIAEDPDVRYVTPNLSLIHILYARPALSGGGSGLPGGNHRGRGRR